MQIVIYLSPMFDIL